MGVFIFNKDEIMKNNLKSALLPILFSLLFFYISFYNFKSKIDLNYLDFIEIKCHIKEHVKIEGGKSSSLKIKVYEYPYFEFTSYNQEFIKAEGENVMMNLYSKYKDYTNDTILITIKKTDFERIKKTIAADYKSIFFDEVVKFYSLSDFNKKYLYLNVTEVNDFDNSGKTFFSWLFLILGSISTLISLLFLRK